MVELFAESFVSEICATKGRQLKCHSCVMDSRLVNQISNKHITPCESCENKRKQNGIVTK